MLPLLSAALSFTNASFCPKARNHPQSFQTCAFIISFINQSKNLLLSSEGLAFRCFRFFCKLQNLIRNRTNLFLQIRQKFGAHGVGRMLFYSSTTFVATVSRKRTSCSTTSMVGLQESSSFSICILENTSI